MSHLLSILLVLLALGALSGCTSPAASDSGHASETPPAMNATAMAAMPLHKIPVSIALTTPGVQGPNGGVDAPACSTCEAGAHEEILFPEHSLFNGTMIDYGRASDMVRTHDGAGIWVFTGSIIGCNGTGTLTMPWTLTMDPAPVAANPNGEVLHGHDIVTKPLGFTGFMDIDDVEFDADYYASPVGVTAHGTLNGYIVCA